MIDGGIIPSLDFYNNLYQHISDAIYIIDPESAKILWVNQSGYKELLMDENEVLHQSVLNLQENVIGLKQWRSIAEVIRETQSFTFIGNHRRKDSTIFPVEVKTTVINYNGHEYFLSIARNITNRCLNEIDLVGREKNIWKALNACSDGVWDWNVCDNSVYFSPSLKRMLGYGPDEIDPVFDTWETNIHPNDLGRVMQALQEYMDGKRERYEAVYRLKNRNAHYLWVHDIGCISNHLPDGQPLSLTGIVRNITDYKVHELRLMELAAYDDLTDLRNRRECTRIFIKQLEFAQRKNQPLSILLLDLDFFKTVNDIHGHLAGDQVLKEIAQQLMQHVRKSDYLFRWGGEEFMLICPATTADEAFQLAEKLRIVIEHHSIIYKGTPLSITASFGTSTYPDNANSREELTLSADSALYTAKSKGRNCVVCAKTTPNRSG
jgi:diguanylate cyclase (GGDEF)-like protein/PAS domain S-box-containing protein